LSTAASRTVTGAGSASTSGVVMELLSIDREDIENAA